MKLSLPENIRSLRAGAGMTQEALAEALGVTFASVSKWERGVATPELTLIARMANLFGVSMDAMVGFEGTGGGAAALEKRIHELELRKKYEDCVIEAEKALLRYPNDFRVVYRCGDAYVAAGVETSNPKYLRRSITLLERAISLLSQNTDPQLSEVSIQQEIAQCHICLGETKTGIELLKRYNVGGIHNPLIAVSLACDDSVTPESGLEEAVPFMVGGFASLLNTSMRTMTAYVNYYFKIGNYSASREAALWLIGLLESVKRDPRRSCYVDKLLAPFYSECANLSLLLGEEALVEPYMRSAWECARRYDAAPTTGVENMKFCIGDVKNAVSYDDLGETAAGAVVQQITQENRDRRLYELWQRLAAGEREETVK